MATTDFSPDLASATEGARTRAAMAVVRAALGSALGHCRQWPEAEAGRLALWTPVALGAGVVLYFSLKVEPPAWIGAALLLAAVTARFGFARARIWTGAALFIALGFAVADWRAARVGGADPRARDDPDNSEGPACLGRRSAEEPAAHHRYRHNRPR